MDFTHIVYIQQEQDSVYRKLSLYSSKAGPTRCAQNFLHSVHLSVETSRSYTKAYISQVALMRFVRFRKYAAIISPVSL
jgi:hypothetical protein